MFGYAKILQRLPHLAEMADRRLGERISAQLQRLAADFLPTAQTENSLQLVTLLRRQG
ncbi:hypothetical protein D3C81_1439150 [compost metagenome]